MGRPCECCSDCVSIWSIDQQNGSIKWKKKYGYVYSLAQHNDLLFALVHDSEPQVVCLRKSNGGKVEDKSFKLPYANTLFEIYAVNDDNIYILQKNTGNICRYIEQELTDIYRFNSTKYKFLNGRILGYGNFTEDYHYYSVLHQNNGGFSIKIEDLTNVDISDIHITLIVEHERYQVECRVSFDTGNISVDILSSQDDLQLSDIFDSYNFGSNYVDLNFHIVPKITQVSYRVNVSTTLSIKNRIFGNFILDTYRYGDGLDGLLQGTALTSYGNWQFHGYESDYLEKYGEVFNVLYLGERAITIPALIEEFKLDSLEYNRYELRNRSDVLTDIAEGCLNKTCVTNTMIRNQGVTPLGDMVITEPINLYGTIPFELTNLQTVATYIRDDSKKIDTNRGFSYGINLVHTDSNRQTGVFPGPYLPPSNPLRTITAYTNTNSATTWQWILSLTPEASEFIDAYNNPVGYVKNVFYHLKILDIHYDSNSNNYILNSQYFAHWLYLREEFLGYEYDRDTGWKDLFYQREIEYNVPVGSNAANISPQYIGRSDSHNQQGFYALSLKYPSPGYQSLAEDFGYCYKLTKEVPSAAYCGGHFIIQQNNFDISYRLTNNYGFDVIVNRQTGVQTGTRHAYEYVFHKFMEPVLSDYSGFNARHRMIYTVPIHTNIITSDFTSYNFYDINQIYPYNNIPNQTNNVNFLESLEYDEFYNISTLGRGMSAKTKYDSYANQPHRYPLDLKQYQVNNPGDYWTRIFDLHEIFDKGEIKQRYRTRSDINPEYFKDKTKLTYNEDLSESILYNNSVRLIVNNSQDNFVYYKSLDGAITTSVDIYTVRYNLSETTVSGLCPIIVFQPVIAPGLENGQIKVKLKIVNCEYNNGTKTYQILNIERDIDLLDGDMTPILNDLNDAATDGQFTFLTPNNNITRDWVMIIFDSTLELNVFSGDISQLTEEVTLTNNDINFNMVDNTYYHYGDIYGAS